MQLNAEEIKELDEISFDLMASDKTLQIALNFHSNQQNRLQRNRRDFWKKLGEKHGFDPEDGYSTKNALGAVTVVKLSDEEKSKLEFQH